MAWQEELDVVVHIDRDLELFAPLRLPRGSPVTALRAALLGRDSAGKVLRNSRFGLRLPDGLPVADDAVLTEELGELEVCDEEDPPAQEPAGEGPAPEPEQQQGPGPARRAEGVTLRTLAGRAELLRDVRPEDTALQLAERAAEVLDIPLRELSLCLGSRALSARELHEPLGRLGLGAGGEVTVVRRAASAGVEVVEYRVLQGQLFKKPSEDPASERVISLTRPTASRMKTTGRTWTGPSGGQWVELDPWTERPGWLLVQGRGFERHGPLLERAVPGEEEPIALTVVSPVFNDGTRLKAREHHLCDICVRPSQTLGQVKSVIALQCPEYKPHKMQLLTLEELGHHSHANGWSRQAFDENDLLLSHLRKRHGDSLPLIVFK